jgi:hypothetical protein
MTRLVFEQPVEAAPLPNSSRASIITLAAALLMLLLLPGKWKLFAIPVVFLDLCYQTGNEGIKK